MSTHSVKEKQQHREQPSTQEQHLNTGHRELVNEGEPSASKHTDSGSPRKLLQDEILPLSDRNEIKFIRDFVRSTVQNSTPVVPSTPDKELLLSLPKEGGLRHLSSRFEFVQDTLLPLRLSPFPLSQIQMALQDHQESVRPVNEAVANVLVELSYLCDAAPAGIIIFPSENELEWDILMHVNAGHWRGLYLNFKTIFPPDYPSSCPKVHFKPPLIHLPDIDAVTGEYNLPEEFISQWKPNTHSAVKVILYLRTVLEHAVPIDKRRGSVRDRVSAARVDYLAEVAKAHSNCVPGATIDHVLCLGAGLPREPSDEPPTDEEGLAVDEILERVGELIHERKTRLTMLKTNDSVDFLTKNEMGHIISDATTELYDWFQERYLSDGQTSFRPFPAQ